MTLQRLTGFLANIAKWPRRKTCRDTRPRQGPVARRRLAHRPCRVPVAEGHFLLDATLGMINIEQNAIIKIVSVAAVVFLPPTLVASIYGMNFDIMPELKWVFGYPFALILMVLFAVLPFWFFRRKGWL
jgi:magnesium transporter